MSATSPVDTCYGALGSFKTSLRTYAPYTYIAYHTLVPNEDSDLIDLATKVGDVATFFFLVNWAIGAIGPLFILLPVVPLLLDIGRIIYHLIAGEEMTPVEERAPVHRRLGLIALLAFAVLGVRGAHRFHNSLEA